MTSAHRLPQPNEVRGQRFGVILVDLQNDFCHPHGVFQRAGFTLHDHRKLVTNVNVLARAARAGGHLVVWLTMVWTDERDLGLLARRSPFLRQEGLRRGTWGADQLAGLNVDSSDFVLEKTRFSAFHRTGPETLLRRERVGHLVVAGVRTDFCVESTVRDAFFRDLEVFVPADAVAGYVDELHEHSLRVMNTVFARVSTLDETIKLLQPPQTQEA